MKIILDYKKDGEFVLDESVQAKLKFASLFVVIAIGISIIVPFADSPWQNTSMLTLPGGEKLILLTPKGVKIQNINPFIKNVLEKNKVWIKPEIMIKTPPKLPFQFLTEINGPNMIDVLNWTNSLNLTYTGENITIGIVDTGIDFGSKGLGMDKIALDNRGTPLLLDADEIGLAITPLNVTYRDPYTKMLATKGKEVLIYIPTVGMGKVSIEYDWQAPKIESKSGYYKFGFFVAFSFPSNSLLGGSAPGIAYLVPTVLVDSQTEGVYDTAFLDLSSTWFTIGGLFYALGALLNPPSLEMLDFSFRDEVPLRIGSGIAGLDFDNDSVYDFSLGVISGYVYDSFGIINKTGNIEGYSWKNGWEPKASGIYPGLDPKGSYVSFFYDPIGHGTSVANIIAGKKVKYYIPTQEGLGTIETRGIAVNAKIAGAMSLFAGNVLASLSWLSGYDYINGTWIYTGNHKADIISNSWGLLYWPLTMLADGGGFAPGDDPLAKKIDELSQKTIIVFAAGNEGPGKESIAMGGASEKVITVGALTIFNKPITDSFGNLIIPGGIGGNVISWSSRGPNIIGVPKPDIVAPGAYALIPTATSNGFGDGTRAIDIFGGTSMATPVVSGIIALLLQKLKEEKTQYSTEKIKELLQQTSKDLSLPPELQGYGLIDGEKLLNTTSTEGDSSTKKVMVNNGIIKLEEKVERIIFYKASDPFYNNTFMLRGFNKTFIQVPLPDNVKNEPIEILVKWMPKNENESLPYTIVWVGGWNDTDSNGKPEIREIVLVDHALLNGYLTSMTLSPKVFSSLEKMHLLKNSSLTIMVYNGKNENTTISIQVRPIEQETMQPINTIGGEKIFDASQLPYGVTMALIEEKANIRKIASIIKPIELNTNTITLKLDAFSSSHSGILMGLGDSITIPLKISSIQYPEKGKSIIGYVVMVKKGDADLYIQRENNPKYDGLTNIEYSYASHPTTYIAGIENFYPYPKENRSFIFIPTQELKTNNLDLIVYVMKPESSIELQISPVIYGEKQVGSSFIINIESPIPLGEITLYPSGIKVLHTGGIATKIIEGTVQPTTQVVLKLHKKVLSTKIDIIKIVTETYIETEHISAKPVFTKTQKQIKGFLIT